MANCDWRPEYGDAEPALEGLNDPVITIRQRVVFGLQCVLFAVGIGAVAYAVMTSGG